MRGWQRPTGPRLRLPLPVGVVMCLYCGALHATADIRKLALSHTRDTGHPTVFRSPANAGPIQH